MRNELDLVDLERLEDAGDVAGLGLFVVATGGMGGAPHAAQIRHDHGVVVRQSGGKRRPHVARLPKAVEQHDRRPVPADTHEDPRTVGGNRLGLEAGGERLDLGKGGRRRQYGTNCHQGKFPHFQTPVWDRSAIRWNVLQATQTLVTYASRNRSMRE